MKWAILRVQLEIPAHTTLSRQSLCPFRYATPSPSFCPHTLTVAILMALSLCGAVYYHFFYPSWEQVTSRRVKRQHGFCHQRKEGFKFGGKVKEIKRNRTWKKKADVCWEFCLVNSSTQTIWKNRHKLVSAFEQNGSQGDYESLN
jgi:hypothetical protein